MATELFNGFIRLGNFPLDERSTFLSYQDADNYAASDPTAYPGQIIAVVNEIAQEVSIYNLIYPSDPGRNYDLQGIAGSGNGTVEFVNNLEPDENGYLTIRATDIQISLTDARTVAEVLSVFEGVSKTEFELIFSKIVHAGRITGIDTAQIQDPSDAINLEYLQQSQATVLSAATRTVQVILNSTGRDNSNPAWYDFVSGDIITRVVVNITAAYDEVDITLKIGSQTIVEPSDIFETQIGTYIVEPSLKLSLPSPASMDVFLDGGSLTGSAIVYIEFTRNPYDSI